MKVRVLCLLVPALLFVADLKAGPAKKEVEAKRIIESPVIDGVLTDEIWEGLVPATDFIQMMPYNGKGSIFRTEVRVAFDDEAIYLGAMLFDPSPDSIVRYFSKRDELGLADYFGIYLDPFNDGINAYGFFVTAAGVQVDSRSSSGNRDEVDESWDAVWESSVKINESGWVAEMKIPYAALRFPKVSSQDWGMNLFRNIRRYREYSSWNFVDQKERSVNFQAGNLKGVSNIKPPMRLAFVPYAATYANSYSAEKGLGYSLKGGMDLKYGLNESYTLDMMLIPDFGQVQSDDEILNLTPFETFYDEKRAFFTEGNELFNRAQIFYSRRIGQKPLNYDAVYDQLKANESVTRNPSETQMINATKISGKSANGIGIGFLNAITSPMYADIEDSLTGDTRRFKTQDFRNYNVSIIEKSLRNNSYISLINTNLTSAGSTFGANVTGTEIKLANRESSYAIFGMAAVSNRKNGEGEGSTGAYYDIDISKISGKFQWTLTQQLDTDKFDPNDLGFRRSNNELSNRFRVFYNIYEPFWYFRNIYNSLAFEYASQFKPFEYKELNLSLRNRMTFSNYFSLGFTLFFRPESFDWYEARIEGRKYIEPGMFFSNVFLSSDYRKKLAFDAEITRRKAFDFGTEYTGIEFGPRLRINDRFFMLYTLEDGRFKNDIGYIENNEAGDSIIFGSRNLNTLVNTFDANYSFNNKSNLSFRLRHYWSYLDYNQYFMLNGKGRLEDLENFTAPDRNFNTFNIDMVYSWFFAPGSELSIVWKNAIESDEDLIYTDFSDNLRNTISSPQLNSISLKILYYLDYQNLKKKTSDNT